MLLPCIRSLVIVAAAVVALGAVDAADLTTFPVDYDMLTVTSEVQVEVLADAVAATGNLEVKTAFESFFTNYSIDVADGTLTSKNHGVKLDNYLHDMDKFVPNFSSTSDAAIANAVVDFFKFQQHAHAASWDVLYYGAETSIQKLLVNATIDPSANAEIIQHLNDVESQLQTVDNYMIQNIRSAATSDLQTQSDSFIATADAAVPGFRDLMYKYIGDLYTKLWNDQSVDESDSDGSTGGSSGGHTGSGSSAGDEAGVPSGSSDATTESPVPTPANGTTSDKAPSPAPTSSVSALATVSSAMMATLAAAFAAMLL